MSETVLVTDTQLDTDSGNHDRFAHYVNKDEATESMVKGWPVVALCGKIWVPSRDPKKFPLCQTCKEIYEKLGFGNGND